MKKTYTAPALRIVSLHIEFNLMTLSVAPSSITKNKEDQLSNKKESGTISWGVSDWQEDKGWNADF